MKYYIVVEAPPNVHTRKVNCGTFYISEKYYGRPHNFYMYRPTRITSYGYYKIIGDLCESI